MIRIGATAIALVLLASPAFAHAIRMKVEVTDSEIRATVRYDGADDDGGPVEFALSRREPLQEVSRSKPGPETTATFPRPEPGPYRMVAQDDFGHRVVVDFEVPPRGVPASAASPERSLGPILAGLAIIAVAAAAWWRLAGRKKHHGA
jgi:hypothetical protein